jgi:hypothetical protein
MQATIRVASVVSSTPPARRRLIRNVQPIQSNSEEVLMKDSQASHAMKITVNNQVSRFLVLNAFLFGALILGHAAEPYSIGYSWTRQGEWTPRPATDEGTSIGNPDDDADGTPAWEYGFFYGGNGLQGNDPWYKKTWTKLVWSKDWGTQNDNSSWVRVSATGGGQDQAPAIWSDALLHITQLLHPWTPGIQWANPSGQSLSLHIDGSLTVDWQGPGGTTQPVAVEVVVAKKDVHGTYSTVFSSTVLKLHQDNTPESQTVQINRYVDVGPTDALVLSFRSVTSPDIWYIFLRDNLTFTVVGSDADSDGVGNELEQNVYGTNPGSPDTDGDGLMDGTEITSHGFQLVQVGTPISWADAVADANQRGGHLATFASQSEVDLARTQIGSTFSSTWAWLGASDTEIEGEWRWITGEPWAFTKWNPGEPSDSLHTENYLLMNQPVMVPSLGTISVWEAGRIDLLRGPLQSDAST